MTAHIASMGLARAFTTRRQRSESTQGQVPYIGRAASQRSPDSKPIKRSQISLPVALISTTNMLSYEAPDIAGTQRLVNDRNVSSSSSVTSGSDSGHDSDGGSSVGGRSRDTMTDASSVDESYSPISPEPNHLSCYFKPTVPTDAPSRTNSSLHSARPSLDYSPTIPQRALSHSKKAHVDLSRKRSIIQRVAAQAQPQPQPQPQDLGISSASSSHPFGQELAQLNEVQEEFGNTVRDAEAEADRAVMQSRDLVRFCAADYMSELVGLYTTTFAEDAAFASAPVGWI